MFAVSTTLHVGKGQNISRKLISVYFVGEEIPDNTHIGKRLTRKELSRLKKEKRKSKYNRKLDDLINKTSKYNIIMKKRELIKELKVLRSTCDRSKKEIDVKLKIQKVEEEIGELRKELKRRPFKNDHKVSQTKESEIRHHRKKSQSSRERLYIKEKGRINGQCNKKASRDQWEKRRNGYKQKSGSLYC